MPNDIRSTVTKKLLKNAFSELIITTPFEKLKIKDICNYANVSRSTFYCHYEDIFALLKDFERDICETNHISDFMITGNMKSQFFKTKLGSICQQIKSNEEFYRAYFNNSEALFITNVLDEFGDELIAKWLKDGVFHHKEDAEYAFLFYKTGIIACIKKWLNEPDESRINPMELSDRLLKIISLAEEFK